MTRERKSQRQSPDQLRVATIDLHVANRVALASRSRRARFTPAMTRERKSQRQRPDQLRVATIDLHVALASPGEP